MPLEPFVEPLAFLLLPAAFLKQFTPGLGVPNLGLGNRQRFGRN